MGHVGGGNELEIRFLADEHLKPNEPGLKMACIDSLEIRRDVKMRLTLDTSSLLPGGKEDVKKWIKMANRMRLRHRYKPRMPVRSPRAAAAEAASGCKLQWAIYFRFCARCSELGSRCRAAPEQLEWAKRSTFLLAVGYPFRGETARRWHAGADRL